MRSLTGKDGEERCAEQLEGLGWRVENLNFVKSNAPNVDLKISRGGTSRLVQVKASARERGYITGGAVNPKVVMGGEIFNRVRHEQKAEFVIFISKLYVDPTYFILPVAVAEVIFRRNIDAYFRSPKLDGGEKRPYGQTDIYVGEDPFPHYRIVPDQRSDVLPYKAAWNILEL